MQPGFTRKVQHQQNFLLLPDAQFSRGLSYEALVWWTDLVHNLWIRCIRDIDDQHTCIDVSPICAAADVGIIAIRRQAGVHAAIEERCVTDQLKRTGGGSRLGFRRQGSRDCLGRRRSQGGVLSRYRAVCGQWKGSRSDKSLSDCHT